MQKHALILLLLAIPGYSKVIPFAELSFSSINFYKLRQLNTKNFMAGSLMFGLCTQNVKFAANFGYGANTCFDSLLGTYNGLGMSGEGRLASKVVFTPISISADFTKTFLDIFTLNVGPEAGLLVIKEKLVGVDKTVNYGVIPFFANQKTETPIDKKRTVSFLAGGNVSIWIDLTKFLKTSVALGYQYSRTTLKGMNDNIYRKFVEDSEFRMNSPKVKVGIVFIIPK